MSDSDMIFTEIDSNESEFEDIIHEISENSSNISDCEFNDNEHFSKNGLLWSSKKPNTSKTPLENIMNHYPGPTSYSYQKIQIILDCLLIFFPTELIDEIIKQTNEYGNKNFSNSWKDINQTELYGVFGALILMGVHKDREEPLSELFSISEGKEIYRELFPYHRFQQILRLLHFDDMKTRDERRENDKFCPVRNIWNMWSKILPLCFFPNEYVTVEQLVPFRGKCPFRQYMPSKPAKYGLKFFLLVDPKESYVYNISPYLGKCNNKCERNLNVGENIVLSLANPLFYSGISIVADNFFTSLSLASKLLKKRITYLGTIRKNKKELPPCVLPSRIRELYSTKFVFYQKNMLTSYVNKKGKCVILLSTGFTNTNIENNTYKKNLKQFFVTITPKEELILLTECWLQYQ